MIFLLDEFYVYLKTEKGFKENTIKTYIAIIKNYFKYNYKITVSDAKKYYIHKLKTTESTYHQKNICYALKHFFSMKGIKLSIKSPKLVNKRRKCLTYKETIIFLESIKDPRDKLMVTLQVQTGLRPSELMNIELGDIDLKKSEILIRNTKTNDERKVYLTTKVSLLLEKYINQRKANSETKKLFLCKNKNKGLSLYQYQRLLRKYSRKSGIKATPYMLRHTFATLFIEREGNLLILKDLLGHKKIETTERYIHECDAMIKDQYYKHVPDF